MITSRVDALGQLDRGAQADRPAPVVDDERRVARGRAAPSARAPYAVWRSYEYQPRSVGLSERPKPGWSGAMQRKPASRTGGMTLRHRNDHVGSPCQNTTGGAVALVDVREPQPVDRRGSAARSGSPAAPDRSSGVRMASVSLAFSELWRRRTRADAQLCIDTIRTLSMDAVQEANSGHPGLPMAMAPAAYLLFARGHEAQPAGPGLARPRPLRPQRRPRLDAALQRPAPHRLRPAARRAQALPPVGLADAGPPRARPRARHARRRGHDRPARPGLRQRRRHGDGRALPARAASAPRCMDHHVYAIVSDGDLMEGIAVRGRVARRPARPRPARLPLRRQRRSRSTARRR